MGIRIFAVTAALTIAVAMGIALGIYFRVIPVPMSLLGMFARTRQAEFSARYYPPDTVAYTWITLTPRGRQMRHMREIWERFNEYPGFVGAVEDWKSGFIEETGISFDEGIATWIGPTMSAGLLDTSAGSNRPAAAAIVGVRDEDAAADFLETWTEYAAAKQDTEFAAGVYQEQPTWVSESGHQAYSLTSDWLVFATDEETLHGAIDRIGGRVQDSLATSSKFQAARNALAETRFASGYLDYEGGADILDELTADVFPIGFGWFGLTESAGQTLGWVGASATWVDRGIVSEWVTPAGPADGLNVANLDEPARLLPADTLGFAAASFDPNVDNWRAALQDQRLSDVLPEIGPTDGIGGMLPGAGGGGEPQLDPDASLADALDSGLELVRATTGIDLETEFFDHLAGTAILAIRDFDFGAAMDEPGANPVEAVAMLSYEEGRRDDLDQTMTSIAELARTQAGMQSQPVDVGGEAPATVFDLGRSGMLLGGETGYRPGYVLHDQYLTFGTTESALVATVALQNGQGENLATETEYRRATRYLPADRQVVAYVDANRIVERLGEEGLRLEADEYETLRDAAGVLSIGMDRGETHSRSVVVVTLFPE